MRKLRTPSDKIYATRAAIVPVTDCWILDIKPGAGGYVRIYFGGKMHAAHRVMWERLKGVLAPGDTLGHTCADPACINPAHMFVSPDWARPGATGTGTRLTASQRLGVLTHLRAGKLTQSEIASRYGVSTQTVYNINRKRKKDRDQIVT